MFNFRKFLSAFVGIAAAILLTMVGTAAAQTQHQQKAEKTQDVRVVNAVPTHPGIPPAAFSVTTPGGLLISGPDPEGTGYAITSLTAANTGGVARIVNLGGFYGTTSDCSHIPIETLTFVGGLFVIVPAGQTLHLTFPQPLVILAGSGAAACLRFANETAVVTTVVGYRLLPAAQPQP